MTPVPDWPLGLAWMSYALSRDLQRAARIAGGPEALWGVSGTQMARVLRAGPEVVERALEARAGFRPDVAREEMARSGVVHVPLWADAYPAGLRRIFDPPFGLFGRGAVTPALARVAEGPVIAIVGSRRPSGAGRRFASDLAASLAKRGAVIVSGLARGIDTAVHEGALDGGGVTLAVLGSGVDHVHPRRNTGLADRICESGAVLAEYWPGTPPAPWRFPARNRIISGLSHAVVVVEAAARSGALITADFALEQGSPVLAVPGWPGSDLAAGCNALLRAGAAICEGPEDVIHEVSHATWADAPAPAAPTATAAAVLGVVGREPCGVDRVAAESGLGHGEVAMALASLELDGVVVRDPGGLFRVASPRSARAGGG